jgi:hypothetical protein
MTPTYYNDSAPGLVQQGLQRAGAPLAAFAAEAGLSLAEVKSKDAANLWTADQLFAFARVVERHGGKINFEFEGDE